ncbi:PilZ domain-containing protein [Desulfobacula toluolica]|uniref:PilZ domain-containing protein n=1 Tax=Desulfobacula toluolica (strain DSM 7467 / Tol2) TaxID=651182 RepID=K0ND89_DESTT|nr:PilZ domain-containing protein [Desulfobacula toluolica]CCK78876.1 uncharacterized protein TOL2_C07070 [Desulfobacula toluolica Tol2]
MIDKLSIIRQILDTDEETDKKILSVLASAKCESEIKGAKIHIEDRTCSRKSIFMEAKINTGKETIFAETENISLGGVFIKTEKKIAKGEDIAIRLISPSGDEFSFISKVVRVDNEGIGVMIKTISPSHQTEFNRFVNQL